MVCNNDVFELMNKIYSSINSKFDGLHYEVISMKSVILNLNNKIDENTALLEKLNSDIKNLSNVQKCIIDEFNNNSLNSNINNIKDTSAPSNAMTNTSNFPSEKLDAISRDLKFLTQKMQQTEKDLFNIKDKLKIIE